MGWNVKFFRYLKLSIGIILVSCSLGLNFEGFKQKEFLQKEKFTDFVLEGEFFLKENKNFEVFFRKKGKKYYQLSFSPKEVIFSGGLLKEVSEISLKNRNWNSFKLVADGTKFKGFLNGKTIFSLRDGFFRKGKIEIPTDEKKLCLQKY